MFLKNVCNALFATATVRLTLYYVSFFITVSVSVFIVFYFVLTSKLDQSVSTELHDEAEEIMELYKEQGLADLQMEFDRESRSKGSHNVFFILRSPDLRILASSDLQSWNIAGLTSGIIEGLARNNELLRTTSTPQQNYKTQYISTKMHDDTIAQIGYSLQNESIILNSYLKIFGIAIVIMIICGGVIGYFITRGTMSGIKQLTKTAIDIGRGDLSRRVPIQNKGDEIDSLARAFNDMLSRIEKLVNELKDVTNNIAHDLRSPLTRMRGVAETTLTGTQRIEDYQAMAGTVIEESDSLVEMINTMLDIAETDAGVAPLICSSVDLRILVRDAFELFHPVAEEHAITFTHDLPQDAMYISADQSKIKRVVANVLDNAFKFTPSGRHIHLSVSGDVRTVSLVVRDTGSGIHADHLPFVFERFYRGDASRSSSGNGLGLSLVKSIVEAHKGHVAITSAVGTGTTVTMTFPRITP